MKIFERNIQEIGSSLLVSLPKDWARSFKLEKGRKLKLMTSGKGHLLIAPELSLKKKKRPAAKIDYDEFFIRRFFREYFFGNEQITINLPVGITPKQRKEVYAFLKKFMNVQIIEETSKSIVVKSFEINDLSIEECLKRMFFLSLSMLDDLTEEDNLSKRKEMDLSLTKFYLMLVMQVRRFLNEGKYAENQLPLIKVVDFRMIAEKVERIADITLQLDLPSNKSLKELLLELKTSYEKLVPFFMSDKYNSAVAEWVHLEKLEKKFSNKKMKNIKDLQQHNGLLEILRYLKQIAMFTR